MSLRTLVRLSWAPVVTVTVLAGALALLCGTVASNLLPSAVAYALLVVP